MASTERIHKTEKRKGARIWPSLINWHLKKLVWKGYKNALTEDDLWNAEKSGGTMDTGEELQKNWSAEVRASDHSGQAPSLAKALLRTYGLPYLCLALPLVVESVFLRPAICYLGGALLESFAPGGAVRRTDALACTGVLAAAILARMVLNNLYLRATARLGGRVRAACSLLLYTKALQIRGGSLQPDRVVSLLTGAVARLEVSMPALHWLWLLHLQTAAGAALLYHVLGAPGACAVAVAYFTFAPVQALLALAVLRLRRSVAPHTEARVRLLAELVAGITTVKANAWEPVFRTAIQAARRSEMSRVAVEAIISGFSRSSVIMVDRLCIFVVLLFCTLFGYRMAPSEIFTAVLFFFDFKLSLAVSFPAAATAWSECKVALEDMQRFLLEEDGGAGPQQGEAEAEHPAGGVVARHASFRWSRDGPDVLRGVSLRLPPGTLCAVVGPVASGKTSLLMALLGELRASQGHATVSGSTSLSPQEAWVFRGSVRQNVVFGAGGQQVDVDQSRYRAVLAACGLMGDLRRLPRGDETPVGERGARLSGGQRARLGLARAAYRDADVYLLDDPLSALDPHVAGHVFRECILKLLAGKTRVLVTHQHNVLPLCDHVIVLNEGQIEIQGTFKEIQENYPALTNIISLSTNEGHILEETDGDQPKASAMVPEGPADAPWREQSAASSWRLLWNYLRMGCGPVGLAGLAAWLLISQAVAHGAIYWLAIWSDLAGAAPQSSSQWLLVWVQGGLSLANVLFLSARAGMLVALAVRAARTLHDRALAGLLAAGLPFYQRCPAGELTAHCCEHVTAVDRCLPPSLIFVMQLLLNMVGHCVVTAVVDYRSLLPMALALGSIYCISRVYGAASSIARSLESKRRTWLYAQAADSLSGLVSIRALGQTDAVHHQFHAHQEDYMFSKGISAEISCEANLWIDCTAAMFALLIIIIITLFGESVGVTSGDVGVVLTLLLGMSNIVSKLLEEAVRLRQHLQSVQSAEALARIPPEADCGVTEKYLEKQWLARGSIEYQHVSLKYESGPVALKDVSFRIMDGEKVAVVGRTGAGKSSLVSALLRLAPASSGRVLAGGVDVCDVPLAVLRRAVCLIPQQPALFAGTLRHNLDPAGEADDHAIWQALQHVELSSLVAGAGLETPVGAGGSGWSAGQRQLVCLARAALRGSRVVVMDEATASMDHQTDAIIQRTWRRLFGRSTVIIIAHRIHTVMDCDKVLVMSDGKVEQFGHPYELLRDTEGMLHSLVAEAGADVLRSFLERAAQTYHRSVAKSDADESTAYSVD